MKTTLILLLTAATLTAAETNTNERVIYINVSHAITNSYLTFDDITPKLKTSITTNWAPTWSSSTLLWPPSANTETHHEVGNVNSNYWFEVTTTNGIARTETKVIPLGQLHRSYKIRKVRDYTEPWWQPWVFNPPYHTNGIAFGTNSIWIQ